MPDKITTVGDLIAAFLNACGVGAAFGVISIHNMPILDAIGRAGKIRFVPSRGEAGAVNMADAYARVGDRLGVAVTSTGTGVPGLRPFAWKTRSTASGLRASAPRAKKVSVGNATRLPLLRVLVARSRPRFEDGFPVADVTELS